MRTIANARVDFDSETQDLHLTLTVENVTFSVHAWDLHHVASAIAARDINAILFSEYVFDVETPASNVKYLIRTVTSDEAALADDDEELFIRD